LTGQGGGGTGPGRDRFRMRFQIAHWNFATFIAGDLMTMQSQVS